MSSVGRVIAHYGEGHLLDRISKALVTNGKRLHALSAKDLKPVDEFHIGGEKFSDHLFDQISMYPTSKVLDIGSGLGGTPRYLASKYPGIAVHGIDLTPEYTDVARSLTAMCGLTGLTFNTGSATNLSGEFEEHTFDVASMIHVGMNIEDKEKIFSEVFRTLKPGGIFAILDVMVRVPTAPKLEYPLPWASDISHSFITDVDTYTAAAAKAGFEVRAVVDRSNAAKDIFEAVKQKQLKAAAAANSSSGEEDLPPLSIAITMGSNAKQKINNLAKQVINGTLCPHEVICLKPLS